MARVHVLVEGDSEESFVNTILVPHFSPKGIYLTSSRVTTKRNFRKGIVYKGGMSGFGKVENEINLFLIGDADRYLTTMFDLFRIPTDFPDYQSAINVRDCIQQAKVLESRLANHFNTPRFIPYIQVHEFEALLFSDAKKIDDCLSILHSVNNSNLTQIADQFPSPEHINNNPQTAPSKRILAIHPSYEKITDGILIAEDVGLNVMRRECSHFNEWITYLESL